MEPMLDVREVTFRFGERTILDQVSLSVEAGEAVAIMGPSGAGKSTFLNVLLGLMAPASGTINIAGQPMDGGRRRAAARMRQKHVGSVFQHGELLPALTPLENVIVPALLAGVPTAEASARGRELLEAVGVGDVDLSSDRLSGGERQRTALARALINRPSLIVADEPTGSLDVDSRDEIADVVFSAPKQWACALVVVTHEPLVAARAQRTGVLRAGGLEWQ
ncbi:ABC transporter ATP-binding protein [Xylanimonas protaetiae]|uniref:ATP-binding cassette domain-containing protein n=1 Tax=Xylanimonas protaetiae TaxID=2509457 RepID=A0A4V0YFT0_9MICO|nr:ATP-binding cassette domain-containing protein [Xylanimonas protaetiae]QAY68781.1 ATP-binding cassette domain-containing protein [Xylanimonas protaetiae]